MIHGIVQFLLRVVGKDNIHHAYHVLQQDHVQMVQVYKELNREIREIQSTQSQQLKFLQLEINELRQDLEREREAHVNTRLALKIAEQKVDEQTAEIERLRQIIETRNI